MGFTKPLGWVVAVLMGVLVSSSGADKWDVTYESGYSSNQRTVGVHNITMELILKYDTVEEVQVEAFYCSGCFLYRRFNLDQNFTTFYPRMKLSNEAIEKTAIIKVVMFRVIQGSYRIALRSTNSSFGNRYDSPIISGKYCPQFTNLQTTKQLLHSDRQFGSKATVTCKNSVFVENSAHMYRSAVVACDAFAKWNDSNLSCYEGQFVDINNAGQKQTLIYNTPVLFYCDPFNPTMNQINLTLDNQVFFGSKYAWGNVTLTPSHHNSHLTCKQTSVNLHQSQSKSVILDVQFPPLIDPNTTVDAEVTLGKTDFVEYKFKSNPPTPSQGAVSIFKQGIAVKNMYYFSNQTETQVVLHFKTVTNTDIDDYLVVINSSHPFYETSRVTIRVRQKEIPVESYADYAPTLTLVIPLGTLLGVFLVVAIVLAVKLYKNEQSGKLSTNKTSGPNSNHQKSRTTNVYNETRKGAPVQISTLSPGPTRAQTLASAQVAGRSQNPNRLSWQTHEPTRRIHSYVNPGQSIDTGDYVDMQPSYEYFGT